MSHNCGHEAHDHDHEHHEHGPNDSHDQIGQGDWLYTKIDREHVKAYNSDHDGANVVKPYDERMDEQVFVESDADEELLLFIPFTANVRLRSIFIKAGPAGKTPDCMKVFANHDDLDFDEARSTEPLQTFDVVQTRDVAEYAVRPSKFSAVRSLSIFFPSNHGDETTRVYCMGFKGTFTEFRQDPVITIYEAAPNPADHLKIRGTETGMREA